MCGCWRRRTRTWSARWRRGEVSARSVLSAQRLPHPAAAVARTPRRHRAVGRAFPAPAGAGRRAAAAEYGPLRDRTIRGSATSASCATPWSMPSSWPAAGRCCPSISRPTPAWAPRPPTPEEAARRLRSAELVASSALASTRRKRRAPADLYAELLRLVEPALLEDVIRRLRGNRWVAAQWLGLNRATVRKKLGVYGLIDHCQARKSRTAKPRRRRDELCPGALFTFSVRPARALNVNSAK